MEAARPLQAPHPGAAQRSVPILPPSEPRPAPRVERRVLEVQLPSRPKPRRTSMRAYLYGALALAAISVAGWFALGEYIYG